MPRTPFFPTFEELPETLPIFPLEGAVVMPASDLPLNIFEPRYVNMVEDALRSHRMLGMIQPDPDRHGRPQPVYGTGCAGRITLFSETPDGRIELVLTGVSRFDVVEEFTTTRGYRLVKPDWQRFAQDLAATPGVAARDRSGVLDVLRRYFDANDLQTDWGKLQRLPPTRLADVLTTLLPLEPSAKQLLLETLDPSERADALFATLERLAGTGEHPRPH